MVVSDSCANKMAKKYDYFLIWQKVISGGCFGSKARPFLTF